MEKSNIKKANFNYDLENNTLFIFPKSRKPQEYKLSECIDDNFILDLDKKGKIIGLEILFASEKLGISKSKQNSTFKWEILITVDKEYMKIKYNLRNKKSEKDLFFEKINENMLNPSITNFAIC